VLARKHPEYFNVFGGGIWRGRIYTAAKFGVILRRPIIYHGLFGSAFFQKLYAPEPTFVLMLCASLEYHALLTLPLFVLSSSFDWLLPLALASLLLSVLVCVVAAAQAELPKRKRRLWSRPLVALLFFMQPIVRGWARYKWRLNGRTQPPAATVRLQTAPASNTGEPPDKFSYWGEGGAHRYSFLNTILSQLEQQGWPHKLDSGWSDHDVEIFGNRWSRLRLATVTEDLGQNRKIFRCRLWASWSLRAWIAFWFLFGAELLVIAFLAPAQPWLWMALLSLPLFGWYLEQEKRNLQQLIATVLDEAARQQNLVPLRHHEAENQLKGIEAEKSAEISTAQRAG
jgi:hypothetical protein